MSRPFAIMALVLATLLLTGCGPIQSTAYLLDTETMLEAARTAQADKLAPYEWTAANLYYAKSKEEVGYSDYEQAVDYGKKAVAFATKARDAALKVGRRNGEPAPSDPPVVPRP
ncbi:MAG: DUF4398 domain-containing protein [Myxococcaceae bacterium]